jgi:hypothetical protein
VIGLFPDPEGKAIGVWTTDPKTGKSVWRDEFPDTAQGRTDAQADTNKRAAAQTQTTTPASTYNTGGGGSATTGQTQANPGTNYGYTGSSNDTGGAATDPAVQRTRAIYEYRPGEKLQDWMQRVFQQGTRDYGGSISPDSSNPNATSPYAQWFQNRYQNVAPANMLLDQILNNSGQSATDTAPDVQARMQAFIGSGTGAGFGTGTQGANQNLGKLNDLLNSFNSGNTGGLSQSQLEMLGQLNNSPSDALALYNAQESAGMGANPLAAPYMQTIEQKMLDEYYDDPVGHDPATHGTFLNNLMKRMHQA